MEVNGKTYVPVAFAEDEALAAFAALRSMFSAGTLLAETEDERESVARLARAMHTLAKAVDKARAERVEERLEDVLRDAFK